MSENNKAVNLSDDDAVYMGSEQLEYFKDKLVQWKADILEKSRHTLEELQQVSLHMADLNDRASSETDHAIELRTRDRQRKLISKIDSALDRIRDGSYGYCEETGEKIGIKRLEARPIATLSLEAQEFHERREKVYRDED
jgi:DnaK suppressor protein